jgi:hypothetical protein
LTLSTSSLVLILAPRRVLLRMSNLLFVDNPRMNQQALIQH